MTTHITIPVEEADHPTRLSTYWMPRHEPCRPGRPLARTLARESTWPLPFKRRPTPSSRSPTRPRPSGSSALVSSRSSMACSPSAPGIDGQAEQALFEATRHWSRAAYELDVLSASDGLCPDGLDEARALSRAAPCSRNAFLSSPTRCVACPECAGITTNSTRGGPMNHDYPTCGQVPTDRPRPVIPVAFKLHTQTTRFVMTSVGAPVTRTSMLLPTSPFSSLTAS